MLVIKQEESPSYFGETAWGLYGGEAVFLKKDAGWGPDEIEEPQYTVMF